MVFLLKLINWLPLSVGRALGHFTGYVLFNLSKKTRKTVLRNLELALPEKTEVERYEIGRSSVKHLGLLFSEFPKVWLGTKAYILSLFSQVTGQALIEERRREDKPIILAIPHLGNWEMLVQWIQINYDLIGLYTPSQLKQIDDLIYRARSQFGGKPYPTTPKGILALLRGLRKGGVLVILPDQVPKAGSGVYAPFFGQPAYTMTLMHKFLQKSKADLLIGYCVRNDSGRFDIGIESPNFDYHEPSVELFNTHLNGQLETMIRRFPEQYVWNYKRYKKQPDDADLYVNCR